MTPRDVLARVIGSMDESISVRGICVRIKTLSHLVVMQRAPSTPPSSARGVCVYGFTFLASQPALPWPPPAGQTEEGLRE